MGIDYRRLRSRLRIEDVLSWMSWRAIAFNGGTALFDLDTDNKFGAMAGGVPSDAPQFDLLATWRGTSQTQLNAQVRKLLRVDDGQWETATAESISEALKQQADAKPKEQLRRRVVLEASLASFELGVGG